MFYTLGISLLTSSATNCISYLAGGTRYVIRGNTVSTESPSSSLPVVLGRAAWRYATGSHTYTVQTDPSNYVGLAVGGVVSILLDNPNNRWTTQQIARGWRWVAVQMYITKEFIGSIEQQEVLDRAKAEIKAVFRGERRAEPSHWRLLQPLKDCAHGVKVVAENTKKATAAMFRLITHRFNVFLGIYGGLDSSSEYAAEVLVNTKTVASELLDDRSRLSQYFASNRDLFENRINNEDASWIPDPVLNIYKLRREAIKAKTTMNQICNVVAHPLQSVSSLLPPFPSMDARTVAAKIALRPRLSSWLDSILYGVGGALQWKDNLFRNRDIGPGSTQTNPLPQVAEKPRETAIALANFPNFPMNRVTVNSILQQQPRSMAWLVSAAVALDPWQKKMLEATHSITATVLSVWKSCFGPTRENFTVRHLPISLPGLSGVVYRVYMGPPKRTTL